jgi:hypothetical protein
MNAPTSGCLAMGEGLEERDFSFQVSSRLSSARARICRACPSAARAAVHSDSRLRLSESAWLRSLLYFPVFLQKTRRTRPQARLRNEKTPARHAARPPGVVSMNTLFSKILVTGVKRKIDLPISF